MKTLTLMALLLIGAMAHAAGAGFKGVDFRGEIRHRRIVVEKIGAEYAPGIHYVDVVDASSGEKFVMLLRDDQIVDEGQRKVVVTEMRSNSI